MTKRFLKVAEFCDAYGVRKTKAYSLIASGAITAVKSGSQTLIEGGSAEAWAASLPRFKSAAGQPNGSTKATASENTDRESK